MVPPAHIRELNLDELPVRFKDLPLKPLPLDVAFAKKCLKLSPRGTIALAAAMSEWVIWRNDKHHDLEGGLLVEAMWACAVHPSYLAPFDINTWPKPSDPIWDSLPSKAFLSIQYHFRKLIENMMGYPHLNDLANWCYNVLETGMFKNKKSKLEITKGKELATTFHSWLHKTTDKILNISPVDEITFKCLIEEAPSAEMQHKFSWGNPVSRFDIDQEFSNNQERIKAIDSFLRKIKNNIYLCEADKVSRNKCWAFNKQNIPMPKGNAYTFNEEIL